MKAAKDNGKGEITKEIEELSRLSHPNIVRILAYSSGVTDIVGSESWLLVVDYCVTDLEKLTVPNKTMREILTQTKSPRCEEYPVLQISTEVLLQLLVHVASGMAYVHGEKKVHLDIKQDVSRSVHCHDVSTSVLPQSLTSFCVPQNVLVANVGTPLEPIWQARVADFGGDGQSLSEQSASESKSRGNVGTYQWMAPEATALNEKEGYAFGKIGPKADVFSFGIMMWMVIRKTIRWFDADDSLIMTSIAGDDGKPVEQTSLVARWYYNGQRPPCDAVPPNLWIVMEACWAGEQTQRPEFVDIVRLLSSDEIDWLELAEGSQSEAEPEAEPSYDDWLRELGLAEKKDGLADCGLDEGLELKQLSEYDSEELDEDILSDPDLDLDEETKDRFREAVLLLSAAVGAEPGAESAESDSQAAFDDLLAQLGDEEAVPPEEPEPVLTSSVEEQDVQPALERHFGDAGGGSIECPYPGAAFDEGGVLHCIGTNHGRRAWINPHTDGQVVAAMSSVGNGEPHQFVGRSSDGNCHTQVLVNSWMSVDLGAARTVVPTHYCLRNSDGGGNIHRVTRSGDSALRNWTLEGKAADAGAEDWQEIRRHDNDWTLAAQPHSVGAWPVDAGGRAFRHLRIRQHGKNVNGSDFLLCSGFEVYGALLLAEA